MYHYKHITISSERIHDPNSIPKEKPLDAPIRVLKEIERHFALLPREQFQEFDHFMPSSFLAENTAELKSVLTDLDLALSRFERLFKDINNLLIEK